MSAYPPTANSDHCGTQRWALLLALALLLGVLIVMLAPLANAAEEDDWVIECADCPKYFASLTDRSLQVNAGGHPHIAYGGDHLYYAWYDGTAWYHETADGITGVGSHAALALDENGYPHISYCDEAHEAVKYAHRDATGWHVETVQAWLDEGSIPTSIAVDQDGYPHIAYTERRWSWSDLVRYAYKDASGWHRENVNLEGEVLVDDLSLALDGDEKPRIVYCKEEGSSFTYAFRNGSGWTREGVGTGQNRIYGVSLGIGQDNYPRVAYIGSDSLAYAFQDVEGWHKETLDPEGISGASVVLDENDEPHISYQGLVSGTMRYAYHDASGWHTEAIPEGRNEGRRVATALALDSAGQAHISNLGEWGLMYARRDMGTWSVSVVDSVARAGLDTSVTLDARGFPHISHNDDFNGLLMYTYQDTSGWHTSAVPTDDAGDIYLGETSIDLDMDGSPHISYQGYHGALKYVFRDADGWHTETLDRSGYYSSIRLGEDNYPHISYCDSVDEELRYAYLDPTGWHTETVDADIGSRDCYSSLALDFDNYPHVGYLGSSGLRYAYMDSAGWHTENLPDWGYDVSLALDSNQRPHVSYRRSDVLKYIYKDATGWHDEIVDDYDSTGYHTSLALDGNDQPHISYYCDYEQYELKYAHKDSSGWHVETLDSEGYVGQHTSLALDSFDNPRISYYDEANRDLKYVGGRCVLLESVEVEELPTPQIGQTIVFTATYAPLSATVPLITWDNGSLGSTGVYSWTLPGTYTLTVTATNPCGDTSKTLSVDIRDAIYEVYLPLIAREE